MNLRDLRKQAGLSVKEVASKLNVAPSTFYQYEKGERGLPILTAYNLALLYGITLDEVVEAIINSSQHDL